VADAEGTPVKNFDEFKVPLQEPSILKTVVDSKKVFVGH
jgi:hypothetical protein